MALALACLSRHSITQHLPSIKRTFSLPRCWPFSYHPWFFLLQWFHSEHIFGLGPHRMDCRGGKTGRVSIATRLPRFPPILHSARRRHASHLPLFPMEHSPVRRRDGTDHGPYMVRAQTELELILDHTDSPPNQSYGTRL